MILVCSAGHTTDTESPYLGNHQFKKPGDKCGKLIRYDVMQGSKYCQRRLKLKDENKESDNG